MRRLKKKIAAEILARLSGAPADVPHLRMPDGSVLIRFPKKWPKKRRPPSKGQVQRKNRWRGPGGYAGKPTWVHDGSGRYVERSGSWYGKPPNYVCVRCRRGQKSTKICGVCARPMQSPAGLAGFIMRVPRKAASDKVWRTFCVRFGLRYERRR